MKSYPLASSARTRSVISAAFIHGRCSSGAASDGISTYVSSRGSKAPLRLPFQK